MAQFASIHSLPYPYKFYLLLSFFWPRKCLSIKQLTINHIFLICVVFSVILKMGVRDRILCGFTTSNQCLSSLKLEVRILSHHEVYSIQHYVIKFVSDLRQMDFFSGYSGLLNQKIPPRCNRNIVKSGTKHYISILNMFSC